MGDLFRRLKRVGYIPYLHRGRLDRLLACGRQTRKGAGADNK